MSTPYIPTPPDSTKVLRYLDVFKFIDLLTTRELYFRRLDRLGDPLEGTLPQSVVDSDFLVRQNIDTITATVRECVCVNCWYFGDEDLRMWDGYAAAGTGLVIRSTIGMLKAALKSATEEQLIGKV